jgi:predicted phage-related endonuclease
MTQDALQAKIAERQEYKRMIEDAQAAMSNLEDEIKAEMSTNDLTTLTVGAFRVNWSFRSRTGVDTAALKKAHPDLADQFTRITPYRVFEIK